MLDQVQPLKRPGEAVLINRISDDVTVLFQCLRSIPHAHADSGRFHHGVVIHTVAEPDGILQRDIQFFTNALYAGPLVAGLANQLSVLHAEHLILQDKVILREEFLGFFQLTAVVKHNNDLVNRFALILFHRLNAQAFINLLSPALQFTVSARLPFQQFSDIRVTVRSFF